MKLLKIIRNDKTIEYNVERTGHQALENADITCKEAPMQSFDLARAALTPVVCKVLQVPPPWATGIAIKRVTISYTKQGTRSVVIQFSKILDATEGAHTLTTPSFQVDDPASGEEGRRQCTEGHAKAVYAYIGEALKYIQGERQQQLLPLDDPNAPPPEPRDGDQLPFGDRNDASPSSEPDPGADKPAKNKRASKPRKTAAKPKKGD